MSDVVEERLPTGVTVASESVPGAESVHLGLWLACGALHEPAEQAGIAHFLEHMVFKGGRRRDSYELSRALEALGGRFDAYTTHEYTCYTLQVLPEHFDRGLAMLMDLVLPAEFDPGTIELEQQVVVEEILEAEDSPADLVNELVAAHAFPNHPLGRPVLGTTESVQRLTAEVLSDYQRASYTAPRTVVAAVGAVDHALLCRRVADGLATLPKSPAVAPPPVPRFGTGPVSQRFEVDQINLCLAAPAPGSLDPDRHAAGLLDALLGATMSSRLFQEVRERRGLAYQVSSQWQGYRDAGIFSVEAVTNPRSVGEVLKVIMAEIEAMRDGTVSEEDLAWVKEYSRTTAVLGLEGLGARLARLARSVLIESRYQPLTELLAAVQAVEADDLRRVARRMFGDGEYVLGLVGPVTEKRQAAWWKVVQS